MTRSRSAATQPLNCNNRGRQTGLRGTAAVLRARDQAEAIMTSTHQIFAVAIALAVLLISGQLLLGLVAAAAS